MTLGENIGLLSLGAALGAVASLLGFLWVGIGILFTFAAFLVFILCTTSLFVAGDITFESTALRIHLPKGEFLVPWNAIGRIEKLGHDQYHMVGIHITDRRRIIESAKPGAARKHVEAILSGPEPEGRLVLTPWIGGLDGVTLARALQERINHRIGSVTP
jgi:hypothetical protein